MPAEQVQDAARTIARAAYGPPARDLATTRNGTVAYAVMRHIPRRWLDAVLRRRLRAPRRHAPGFVTMKNTASSTSRPANAPAMPICLALRW